jgi:glycerol-3-phosphate dehydrogenase
VNIACRQLERAVVPCGSRERPLPGGDIENFPRFAHELAVQAGAAMPADTCAALARNHGTNARRVLALAAREPALGRCITGTSVLAAEIAYTVREEMAQRLTDIVFRRTELGTDGNPGTQALDEAEDIMGRECAWSERRSAEERARVERQFARYLAPSRGTPRRAESA